MRKVVRRVKDTDPLESIDDKLNNLTYVNEKNGFNLNPRQSMDSANYRRHGYQMSQS